MNLIKWQTHTSDTASTEQMAQTIGASLKGGEVIDLVSDLGGGKTVFVKGLARGAGSQDHVSSPTFTLRNQYQAGDKTIHHFDFYRLHEPGIISVELMEVIQDPQAVTVVEWSDIVKDVLPEARLTIKITATAETERKIDFSYPESLAYLIKGVKA